MSVILVALAFACLFSLFRFFSHRPTNNLPPGPHGLPFFGNALQLPRRDVAQTYAAWARTHGDVVYMRVFGRAIVHLNSAEAATALLVRRSALYSDRPRQVMGGELVGRARSVVLQPYGPRLHTSRRLLHVFLNARETPRYWAFQEHAAHLLMAKLLETPERFAHHINSTAAAVVLRFTYGYTVTGDEDRLVQITEALTEITTKATEPGRWAVDSFPWLKVLPAWLPGVGWKRWAAHARRLSDEFTNVPYQMVKGDMAEGTAVPSFTSQVLQAHISSPPTAEEEDIVKYAAASLYNGATHTTVSLITTFILLMARHPAVQRRAQAEVDALTGGTRLPRMADAPHLPFLDCVLQEVHRFNPPIPLVPHRVMEDDTYRGFRIPKGAWVVANNWAITHDSRIYPEPDTFAPARFEAQPGTGNAPQPDPRPFSFGYGRRKCPALHFATAAVFVPVAQLLAAFDIAPVPGCPAPPAEFVSGISSQPKPFRCAITPRSAAAAALVRDAAGLPTPALF